MNIMFENTMGVNINVYGGNMRQLETVYADISALTISTLVSITSTEDNKLANLCKGE